MALLDRVFGNRKSASPSSGRIDHAVSPEQDVPRPVRGVAYREAFVVYESGYTRRGIVLDYSNTGVRLRFPTNENLPAEVQLNAKAVNINGRARVVWQENSEVGLTLIP
ncbi:PilZ domain-containing protein [Hyphomonas johnsonii]|jgi:hypothetical protein|uniref:PilZ domain-containing protein n=1 Tax=Hyphomonas johnsonii MHS-2 TaxID=1280950 RepID=A0A059FQI1_9PROT|nr:PilZ domain-containing protein [Hyphomonas johnsonii]KCZ92713.1 hypothetical protein HJO_07157 [Hyphomonas johnsonii MHS-2]